MHQAAGGRTAAGSFCYPTGWTPNDQDGGIAAGTDRNEGGDDLIGRLDHSVVDLGANDFPTCRL
jgi:hypothetical protein